MFLDPNNLNFEGLDTNNLTWRNRSKQSYVLKVFIFNSTGVILDCIFQVIPNDIALKTTQIYEI